MAFKITVLPWKRRLAARLIACSDHFCTFFCRFYL